MISFKRENWYVGYAQNRHLTVLWRGEFLFKIYTHRYHAYGNESQTIGARLAFQAKGHRIHGITLNGDCEYMGQHKSRRKLIRVA